MTVDKYLSQANTQKNTRSTLRRIGSTLSVLVILSVFWGLKLTGITMAGEAFCGMEEHAHSEACAVQELICDLEEIPAHTHGEECLEQLLICTEAEAEGHIHGEGCAETTLICTISDEPEPHSHDDGCYTVIPVCGLEETEAQEPVVESILDCGLEEVEGHSHGDDCYVLTAACGMEESEGHRHSEECTESVLTCEQMESEDHSHGDDCYAITVICGEEESEGHQHSEECMESVLACEVPESEGHSHDEACYVEVLYEGNEGHTHDESCMESTLICEEGEGEPHVHGADCYIEEITCTLEEQEEHTHSESCYEAGAEYICGVEETEGHAHGEACYSTEDGCSIEEHTHVPSCYSDISADVETSDIWEESLMDLIRSPLTSENIVMVAQSQLGVAESTRNFQVDEAGVRRGITRYGQWYGNPYGDWSAMFACFCLEYAGVMDVPTNVGPEAMRLSWAEEGLYAAAADGEPIMGYLLFLDKDQDGTADAVAVIEDFDEEQGVIFAIEGNLSMQVTQIGDVALHLEEESEDENAATESVEAPEGYTVKAFDTDRVAQTLYKLDDPVILGYGEVPFEPGLSVYAPGDRRIIWLDGTDGGLMGLSGSPNTRYYSSEGATFTLPTEWQSPSKYNYKLRGWYDVVNNRYYAPGAEVKVGTQNLVFYADWVAASYDIGQFNAHVTNTVSTSDFVTIRMFDYSQLFNVMSVNGSVTSINDNSHTESWSLVTSGNTNYNNTNNKPTASNKQTLNFIFRDWDTTGDITYPNNTNAPNTYDENTPYYAGLYNQRLVDLLFDPNNSYNPATGEGVIGKQYLGTADHLFQLCTDPSDPNYGYHFYDSEQNAASYNQSDGRFYVYDYLERTTDSGGSGEGTVGKYSDFLPLNSPYTNTAGKTPDTYSYVGVDNEYQGTTHYQYESKEGNSAVSANFLCGMSVDISFYLPNTPGTQLDGGYGNRDVYGKEMHFKFAGDDDVWVFVDGVMVLDLGGIHGIEKGDVNFSTGTVTVDGVVNTALSNALKSIGAGEHTLTIYYLERGSSQSNCTIYFNLAPRFSFSIQKEDTLTKNVLNGAQFSVYTDQACTQPARLWTSKASHDRGDASTHVFTVTDGVANMWGLGAGNTYYIKETRPPDSSVYSVSYGIIKLKLDKTGSASYNVDILSEQVGQGSRTITNGFTVHGFRIDEQIQEAYIVATNAPSWVTETTRIYARKIWADGSSHAGQSVTVYLTVVNQDGSVRRLQEGVLSDANGWYYEWENMPKKWQDGSTIEYRVEEAYVSGYFSKVERVENYNINSTTWTAWKSGDSFQNGETYLLRTGNGCLASNDPNSGDTGFTWLAEDVAKETPQALWTASVNGSTVKFTNGSGQTLTFYYDTSNGYASDYFAYKPANGVVETSRQQDFNYVASGDGIQIYYNANRNGGTTRYYLGNAMNDSSKFNGQTDQGQAMRFTPVKKTTTTINQAVDGWAYTITNTTLTRETSLTVQKYWNYGMLQDNGLHNQEEVTVKLLANGKDTGRTLVLSMRSGWSGTFRGLPYEDDAGNPISYSVREAVEPSGWKAEYGAIVSSGGTTPTYSTTITNRYIPGIGGPKLPSTGTAARLMYILCGGGIMLTSLVYGIRIRYRRERRKKVAP